MKEDFYENAFYEVNATYHINCEFFNQFMLEDCVDINNAYMER